MQEHELEGLFERYRSRGDVDALARVFDAAAPELQTLARHLVREPSEAEDLLQETFLGAIERAEHWEHGRRLMPWLVGVLVVGARRRARERARTPDPRRLGAEPEAAPDNNAAAREFRTEVERALASLSRDERELLAQYLLEERQPHEIANDEGLAPGTVRMRIQRALESLRRLLPVGAALGGAVLITSSRSLAEVRQAVLARGRERAPEFAAVSAGVLARMAVLPKALLGLALVASTGVAAWLALESGSGHKPEGDPGSLAVEPALAHGESPAARVEAGSAAGERTPAADAGAIAAGDWVRIAIEEPAQLQPGTLHVLVKSANGEASLRLELPAARELLFDVGSLANAGPAPASLLVRVDHPEYMPETATVEWPASVVAPGRRETRGSIRLRPAVAFVEGTIELDGLQPDARGLLALVSWNEPGAQIATVLDEAGQVAQGRFRLRSPHGGEHVLVVAHAGATPYSAKLQLTPARTNDVGALALSRSLTIRGRVLLPDPAGGWCADVRASIRRGRDNGVGTMQGLAWNREQVLRGNCRARTDADGRFELRGLSKSDYELRFDLGTGREGTSYPIVVGDWTKDGLVDSAVVTREASAPTEDLVVDLTHAARRGFVLRIRSGGQPVPGADVLWLLPDHGSMGNPADARGEVEVVVATEAPFRLRVSKAGFQVRELELRPAEIVQGSVMDVNLESGPPVVELEFETGDVQLGDGFWATLFPLEALGDVRPDPSDVTQPSSDFPGRTGAPIHADGLFGSPVSAGRYWGRILPRHWPDNQGATDVLPASFECTLEPGRRNRVHVEMHHGARLRIDSRACSDSQAQIRLVLTHSSGKPERAEFWERSLDANGTPRGRGTVDAVFGGTQMESAPLPPGEYSLVVRPREAEASDQRLTLEAGKSCTVVLKP